MRIFSVDVGVRNLAFCELEDGAPLRMGVFDLRAGAEGGARATLADDVAAVVETLRLCVLEAPDVVLVETQMKARMRALQAAIMAFFHAAFPGTSVRASCPRQRTRFTAALVPAAEDPVHRGRRRSYDDRKAASCAAAADVLRGSPLEQEFAGAPKQDDLADALMQGLAFARAPDGGRRPKAPGRQKTP